MTAQIAAFLPADGSDRSPAYGSSALRRDLLAGATVAAIALPQAMAYALIAGVDPRFGLYSAIVVTAIAAVFGSSSHLVNGPTNAISIVVFSALAYFDPQAYAQTREATFLLAIMAGAIQIVIAIAKLGDLTRYISESVVLGFMAGAGLLVGLGQVGNLLGLSVKGTGRQIVVERLWITLTQDAHPNPRAIALGIGTIVLVVALRKVFLRLGWPKVEMLAALVVAAAAAAALSWSNPDPVGHSLVAVIGRVPAGLPAFHVPAIRFEWVPQLSGSALAIAVLGLLEALAVAKSIALDSGQTLDYNRQCFAEGLANLGGGFFQCLPGSGSLTRSAINYQSGAVSRASGLFAAAAVAAVVAFYAPLARFVPKAALAGLLMVTAARLVDVAKLRYTLRASTFDALVVLATAFTAIFVNVELSILVGVALSVAMFVPRAARLKATELVVSPNRVIRRHQPGDPPCSAIAIYDIEGELFFGASPDFRRYLSVMRARVASGCRVVVVRLRRARDPDLACMEVLERFLRDVGRTGAVALLSGVGQDVARAMARLRFDEWLPPSRIFFWEPDATGSSTIRAVRHAYTLIDEGAGIPCPHCTALKPESDDWYYMV